MYSRIAAVLLPILAVAVVGTTVWGYQENQEKNSILIKTENQYQRAFHELNHHVNKLQDELGKSLAISSHRQMAPCLSNVWRLAYAAQSEVGQLPLTLMPFNKTEEFLSNIADYSYQIAFRDLQKQPLTDQEWKTLQKLYQRSNEIQQELQRVQSKVIDNHLRWMDVETALAMEDKQTDNTIIDGFKTIDKQVQEYDVDWESGTSVVQSKQQKINVQGKKLSSEEAKKQALEFLNLEKAKDVKVTKNGKGEKYNSYSVFFKHPQKDERIHVDVTQRGGKVIWLMKNREIKDIKMDLQQAEEKAAAFLKKHGYESMTRTLANQYDNIGVYNFVSEQDGVRIYPDEVTVKVALDNGEIMGFQATSYLANHSERTIKNPKLNEAEARKKLSTHLNVQESRLALIENKRGQEVLCHEFLGTIGNNTYRVYINAANGMEEEVEKL